MDRKKWNRNVFNAEKSAIAERLIKALDNKIYKYTTSVSKNLCIDR